MVSELVGREGGAADLALVLTADFLVLVLSGVLARAEQMVRVGVFVGVSRQSAAVSRQ